ncbi:MAG: hypothetical protein IJ029_06435 [Lachnospiraceae bacterium]|nr:hypothetical protein [Lachnospiraceae bacterium]
MDGIDKNLDAGFEGELGFSNSNMVSDEEIEKWLNEALYDVDLFESEDEISEISESETLFKEAKDAYNRVDDKLLDFIGNFVTNQNNAAQQKKTLKNIFFWFTMISFAIIIVTPIICLLVLMHAKVRDYYIIFGAIVASLLEVLTTIIVLPKIVAEYLFNKEEEASNIKIVELMQKYSEMIHGYDAEKENE